jgi:hypothetical protein
LTITDHSKDGRKWVRALIFIAPVGLWRLSRDTARDVRDTVSRSIYTLQSSRGGQRAAQMDWNMTIAVLAVTPARIRREVRRRQLMASVSALFFLIGLYGLIVRSAFLPGIGCACLSALYYLQASLRLYQIRVREFVSTRQFFARGWRDPREFLPLGLPPAWTLNTERTR